MIKIILVLILVFSVIFTLKETIKLIYALYVTGVYKYNRTNEYMLLCAISYIITIIICGINT